LAQKIICIFLTFDTQIEAAQWTLSLVQTNRVSEPILAVRGHLRRGPTHIDAIAIADVVGTANQKQQSTSGRPSFGSKELDNRFDEKTTKAVPRDGRCLDSGEAPSER
jgi:hypothetical protein